LVRASFAYFAATNLDLLIGARAGLGVIAEVSVAQHGGAKATSIIETTTAWIRTANCFCLLQGQLLSPLFCALEVPLHLVSKSLCPLLLTVALVAGLTSRSNVTFADTLIELVARNAQVD